MEKIYKDGEVLEATDLNSSFAELEAKIKAITLQKMPTPPLADGVRPGNSGFSVYKIGQLVIFQGALVVEKYLGNNNFLAGVLPEELRPKNEVWFPTIRYKEGRNLIIYPDGRFIAKSSGMDTTLSPGWFELGAVIYVVEPAQQPAAATQSTNHPLEES